MNITTAYRQMAQESYDEVMQNESKLIVKPWGNLPMATQIKLSEIYAKHHLGNLQAEGSHLRDAVAEIYQLGKGTSL